MISKENFFTFVSILSLVVFLGCDTGVLADADVPDILPSVGSDITARNITTADQSREELVYYFLSPVLYNFRPNTENLGSGRSFTSTNDVFGSIDFTIERTGGTFRYSGKNAGDTLRIVVDYTPSSKTFSYWQYLYFNDVWLDILQNGSGLGEGIQGFVYSHGSNIQINQDTSFIGNIESFVLAADSADVIAFQGASGTGAELYHGEMLFGLWGTGVVWKEAYQAFTGDILATLPDSLWKPTNVNDMQDLDKMTAYLSDVGIAAISATDTDLSDSYFGDVFYRVGNSDNYAELLGDSTKTLPEFLNFYSLTKWAEVTSYQ